MTDNGVMLEWLQDFIPGTRVEWHGFTGHKEAYQWLPAVVVEARANQDDAIVFFRLDSEQRLHLPHELHWIYRDRIRLKAERNN